MTFRLAALLAAALAATSCAGLDSAIREAEKTEGNLCASYIGPWGTIQISKSHQDTGSLRCRPDGHTFRDKE